MPALDVSLCSDALLLLGAGTISSFEDGTDKATVAGNLYPGVRDALITAYRWRFTIKKVQLARLSDAPATEWAYQFQQPSDCLRICQMFDSAAAGANPFIEYEVFGQTIHADVTSLWADYQFRPDEATFPPYFKQLLRYALAADLAHSIVDSDSKADYWWQKAFGSPGEGGRGGYFATCRGLDAQQQPGQQITSFPLLEARMS